MPSIALTDRTVSAARADPGSRLELWDTKTPGLCLRVSGSGSKVWLYRYRTLDGRQPRLKLGEHSSAFGLAAARQKAEKIRVSVREGSDPASEKRRASRDAKAEPIKTFDHLADAYLAACESGEWKPKNKKKRARTLADETGILRRNIRPVIGQDRLEEVTRQSVKSLLRGMIQKGIGAQTNRTQAVIRQVFAYAIAEERVQVNPATGFAPLATEKPRTRVLTDDEIKAFWAALVDPTGLRLPPKTGEKEGPAVQVGRHVRIALQLALLTLQRRGEIAGMRRSELDILKALWLIPAERMKGGVPHLVPLTPLAVQLIEEAIKLSKPDDAEAEQPDAVFASPHSAKGSITADSLSHAMREIVKALSIPAATPHDLRRTGSTALTSERLGTMPFIRSQVLSHRSDAGGGAAVSMIHYDANSYIGEKRRALGAWERLILEIVTGSAAISNVRAIRSGG